MPRPRKVEKNVKPKEETAVIAIAPIEEMSEGTIELPLLKTGDDTITTSKETVETPTVETAEEITEREQAVKTMVEKLSKREQIDKLLANPCTFYPDPTRLQYGTEMWPWLKQLSDLLE